MNENNQNNNQYGVTVDEVMDFLKDNMATKEDLKLFATKEDLKLFATKEDLKLFATKEDLKLFATKEDLKLFATKEDLTIGLNKQKLEIIDHVDNHIDERLADLKGDLAVLTRKEDRKLVSLIELLRKKEVITVAEAKGIFQMEPFPQIMA